MPTYIVYITGEYRRETEADTPEEAYNKASNEIHDLPGSFNEVFNITESLDD